MVCWELWKARNNLVWNQKGGEITEVVVSTTSVLNHWISVQDKTFDNFLGFMTQDDGAEHWKAPNVDKIKVNTDAAIFETSNCYSYSLVARNHNGELIEASTRCIQGKVSPEMAEVMGIILSWVRKQPGLRCEIETDSLLLIKSSSVKLSYIGRLVKECKDLFPS